MKVVLDTNVLLSGLMLSDSIPGSIVRAWRVAQFDLVLSEPMLDEIRRVLGYPKIQRRLRWDSHVIDNFILLLRFRSTIVDISGVSAEVPADPNDNFILATLIAGQAECLITGDGDLLAMRDVYPILTPAEFVKRL